MAGLQLVFEELQLVVVLVLGFVGVGLDVGEAVLGGVRGGGADEGLWWVVDFVLLLLLELLLILLLCLFELSD